MGLGKTTFPLFCAAMLAAFGTVSTHAAPADSTLLLLPVPQSVNHRDRFFKITSQTRIILGKRGGREDLVSSEHIQTVLRDLRETELRLTHEESLRKHPANYIFIGSPKSDFAVEQLLERKLKAPRLDAESYLLDVRTDGVLLLSESPKGRFYAVLSLLQLFRPQRRSIIVPEVTIHDWPAFSIRGIIEDSPAPFWPNPEHFKKLVDFLSRYKLNAYVISVDSITDVFRLKQLQSLAKERYIDIIPKFAATELLKENNLDDWIIRASRLFTSSSVYIGASEKLPLHSLKRISAAFRKEQKIVIMDADAADSLLTNQLQGEIVFLHQSLRKFPIAETKQPKGRIIVSMRRLPESGTFPPLFSLLPSLLEQSTLAKEKALGLLIPSWGHIRDGSIAEFNLYGYAWTAQCGWNPIPLDHVRFDERFFADLLGGTEMARVGQLGTLLLSQPPHQVSWNELWTDPLKIPSLSSDHHARIQSIASSMSFFLNEISKLPAAFGKERMYVNALSFAARLNLWFARKMKLAGDINRQLNEKNITRDVNPLPQYISSSREMALHLRTLRDEFQSLWLMTNRPEGLPHVIQPYNHEIAAWEKIVEMLLARISGHPENR